MSAARPRGLVSAASREEAAHTLAERHGPPDERPGLKKDLRIRRQVQMGDVNFIVKNPETHKYFMFREAEWYLIRLFDGVRTRQQILDDYNKSVRNPISINLVLSYEESLRRMDLLEQSVVEANLALAAVVCTGATVFHRSAGLGGPGLYDRFRDPDSRFAECRCAS